jgi:hypothetical protein
MFSQSTKPLSCKDSYFGASPVKHLPLASSQVASTLALLAAVIFTVASASVNLLYGIAKGTDLATSIVWAAVAVATSIGLALAPSALIASLTAKRYTAALMALAGVVIFGTYSITAALGSASGGRMAAQNEASEVSKTRSRHQATYDSATEELVTLSAARPAKELQAEIASLLRTPGADDCKEINGKVSARVCPQVDTLRVEVARAEKREALQTSITVASTELAKLPTAKVANTDALALAGYLNAFGMQVTTDTLNRLLVIMAVLVIEFGGGLSLASAMALSSTQTGHWTSRGMEPNPDRSHTDTPAQPQTPVSAPATPRNRAVPASVLAPTDKRKRTSKKENGRCGGPGSGGQRMPANVVDLLKSRGGRIEGGQRGLAKLLGVGKSRMNEVLHELAATGAVCLSTSKSGTTVALAAA